MLEDKFFTEFRHLANATEFLFMKDRPPSSKIRLDMAE